MKSAIAGLINYDDGSFTAIFACLCVVTIIVSPHRTLAADLELNNGIAPNYSGSPTFTYSGDTSARFRSENRSKEVSEEGAEAPGGNYKSLRYQEDYRYLRHHSHYNPDFWDSVKYWMLSLNTMFSGGSGKTLPLVSIIGCQTFTVISLKS